MLLYQPIDVMKIRGSKRSNTFGFFKERSKVVHAGWDLYAEPGTQIFPISNEGSIVEVFTCKKIVKARKEKNAPFQPDELIDFDSSEICRKCNTNGTCYGQYILLEFPYFDISTDEDNLLNILNYTSICSVKLPNSITNKKWVQNKKLYQDSCTTNIKEKVEKGNISLYAFYAHLSEISVNTFDSIKNPNLSIGKTGKTGNAFNTDAHLHFEIRYTIQKMKGLTGKLDPSIIFGSAENYFEKNK
jgi:hypothetical protein